MFQRHGKVPNFTTLVPMMSIVHSRVSPSIIDIKDKVWQTVFVSDILQACMQMSAISFNLFHVKRWKRETFLHATKEIGDVCTQVTLKRPWWVTQLHNNYL